MSLSIGTLIKELSKIKDMYGEDLKVVYLEFPENKSTEYYKVSWVLPFVSHCNKLHEYRLTLEEWDDNKKPNCVVIS